MLADFDSGDFLSISILVIHSVKIGVSLFMVKSLATLEFLMRYHIVSWPQLPKSVYASVL